MYPSLFLKFAKMGMDVSLLVTLPVYERIKEEFTAELRACLKIELDLTIRIGLIHLNQKIVALNR